VNVKRQLTVALLVGVGSGLVGCKSPMGGLAFWNKGDSSVASSSPDTGRQNYEGLAKEFGADTPKTGMGGTPAASDDGPIVSSWNKTTGAIAAALASKPKIETDDPTSLTSKTGKIGPDVHVRAARLMEAQNKSAEAIAHYEKALKIAPNDLTAIVGLARLHDRDGRSAKAVETYQKALKAHPKSALVHNDLGLCYARQKQWQRAGESLNKAVALQPTNAKYRNNLATVMVEMGRPDDALKQLAAVNSPAVAHFNLAYLLEQKGQNPLAVQHLQKAVNLDRTLAPAHEMLARLSNPLGNPSAPAYQPQPDTRVAAQPVSAPVTPKPTDIPWQPQAATSPIAETAPQANETTESSKGQTYHIGDDIGPIQPYDAASGASPISTGETSPAQGELELLPPVEG
jgi:tetratricopeptide (TPR) repeat protein